MQVQGVPLFSPFIINDRVKQSIGWLKVVISLNLILVINNFPTMCNMP